MRAYFIGNNAIKCKKDDGEGEEEEQKEGED